MPAKFLEISGRENANRRNANGPNMGESCAVGDRGGTREVWVVYPAQRVILAQVGL